MNYILHIDTSADLCAVAITGDGAILTYITGSESRSHASQLNGIISLALANINIRLNELSAIAVCSGPGSYTGLRIGMSTAKGICYAIDVPLILQDKLSLLAIGSYNSIDVVRPVAVILSAREKEHFICIYNNKNEPCLPPQHVSDAEMALVLHGIENLHIVADVPGEKFYQLGVNFSSFSENITIDYQSWAECAAYQYNCKDFVNLTNAVPLYLKQVYTHK